MVPTIDYSTQCVRNAHSRYPDSDRDYSYPHTYSGNHSHSYTGNYSHAYSHAGDYTDGHTYADLWLKL